MVRRYLGGKDMQDLIQEDRQDWMPPRIRGQLEAELYSEKGKLETLGPKWRLEFPGLLTHVGIQK
ncbi:hypothetical protein ACRRTK_005104 [Alexandromys fortis]